MNALLIRAGDVVGRPVLTLHGDAIAQVKDVVVDPETGRIRAFTLSGRGLLSGPLKEAIPWSAVHALGRDAVMVADRNALREGADRVAGAGGGANVLGRRVLTHEGEDVGKVTDVVLDVTADEARLVGYEVRLDRHGEKGTILVPVSAPVVVSADNVLVPAAAMRSRSADLAEFREAAGALPEEEKGDAEQ
ncbi:PRC-barrel domain containing protein [Streptomyces sp. R302]|uniref:PRC-barrel domain-containing protein n=1 Tax=unclassified Streptomyces TaxID=2593676 RepID=UPI00145D758B|nr:MULTISPECIES: PRC-barrel domain-containing protein [unclassified Streptomyces]NML49241.1 PRC-barrel domain containing protein [Streptomyces sp. R301]NML77568.1 PRC-barrel domain containing protein [Streptomyces sp. R302]